MQEFCRNFLSGGVGDVNRHLGTLGVTLAHKQTALHEYDFTVSQLATDLRDGVRLCRLVDVATATTPDNLLVNATRLANSRLNKVHNAELAIKRMASLDMLDGVATGTTAAAAEIKNRAKALVEGHREATLELLWGLVSREVMPRLAPAEAVAKEVKRARKAAERTPGALRLSNATLAAASDESVQARLLTWLAAVCAVRGLRVHDLNAGLRDGLAFCLVLRHYVPQRLLAGLPEASPPATIEASNLAASGLTAASWTAAATKEAEGRLAAVAQAVASLGCVPPLMGPADSHGCGPDAHVSALYLAFLFARLTHVGQQSSAAQLLQLAWRGRDHRMDPWVMLRRLVRAARIQTFWKRKLLVRVSRTQRKALLVLKHGVRGRIARHCYARARQAVVHIQAAARRLVAIRHAGARLAQLRAAAMQRESERKAATALQSSRRRMVARVALSKAVGAATLIATRRRGVRARRSLRLSIAASVTVQAAGRRLLARVALSRAIKAAVKVQAMARMVSAISLKQLLRAAAMQRESERKAATALQSSRRRMVARVALSKAVGAATLIATRRRGVRARRLLASAVRRATVLRAAMLRSIAVRRYNLQRLSSLAISRQARRRSAYLLSRTMRAARRIQSGVRGHLQRSALRTRRTSATTLAAAWRRAHALAAYHALRAASVTVQAAARRQLARQILNHRQAAAATLVTAMRRFVHRRRQRRSVAATLVQALFRGTLVRVLLTARAAATSFIAASWKARCAVRALRAMRGAATTLQSRARSRMAALRLQRSVRASVLLGSAARRMAAVATLRVLRADFQRRSRAATVVQCLARSAAAKKNAAALRALAHLAELSKLHRAASFVQARVREHQALRRRHVASRRLASLFKTVVATRWLRRLKQVNLQMQSRLRARRTRARAYQRMPILAEIAKRAEKARVAAVNDPRLWLCNRTNAALEVPVPYRPCWPVPPGCPAARLPGCPAVCLRAQLCAFVPKACSTRVPLGARVPRRHYSRAKTSAMYFVRSPHSRCSR